VCHTGVTEQGQGAEAVVAQCVATAFGVPIERVRVITGDTDNTPYGGGTWASRAAGIGGEAAWQAGKALRMNVLAVAASILQAAPAGLGIRNRGVGGAETRRRPLGPRAGARIAHFPPRTAPRLLPAPTRARAAAGRGGRPPATTCRAPGRSPSPTASRRPTSRSTSRAAS